MSRFGDAVFTWMQEHRLSEVSSENLWCGLEVKHPELTTKTPTRKT
jgi:hypothetical protein